MGIPVGTGKKPMGPSFGSNQGQPKKWAYDESGMTGGVGMGTSMFKARQNMPGMQQPGAGYGAGNPNQGYGDRYGRGLAPSFTQRPSMQGYSAMIPGYGQMTADTMRNQNMYGGAGTMGGMDQSFLGGGGGSRNAFAPIEGMRTGIGPQSPYEQMLQSRTRSV